MPHCVYIRTWKRALWGRAHAYRCLWGACTHVQVSVGGRGARCTEFTVPLTVEGCEFSQEENEEKDYFARCLDSRIR